MGSTYFIAGVYGVGKSTLCSKLSKKMQIPYFSAGDLISEVNGEVYGANKAVADKENNQIALAKRVQKLNQEYEKILLAGHFCIFNSLNEVDVLPELVFDNLNIEQIVLLEVDEATIIGHLKNRDNKIYYRENISQLVIRARAREENCKKIRLWAIYLPNVFFR